MPILILILCFSGISSVSYTLMISDVTNEFTIFSEDDVQLKLVDGDGIVINGMGGFSRKANDGKGASKIFYTGSCTDGNPEQLLYYVIAQSLELGKTNLDISVKDKTVKYVRVSFELKWASDFNPVEEYGLDLKLCISGTGMSISEGVFSKSIDVSEIQDYEFILKGNIDETTVTKHKPEDMVYTITVYVEPY